MQPSRYECGNADRFKDSPTIWAEGKKTWKKIGAYEEGLGVLAIKDLKINALRINVLMGQAPVEKMAQGKATRKVECDRYNSDFLEVATA